MGILFNKPADAPGKAWPAILIGLFVAFGGVLFGYDTGAISGILAMPYWVQRFAGGYTNAAGEPAINPSDESLIVSILSAGTCFGALTAGPVADFFGRRLGLILSTAIVFKLGVILQTIATSQPLFIAGRFFAGFGVGLISAIIPLYQSETAPKWIRGTIVGSYQLAITISLFLAAIVINATKDRNDTGSYRIPVDLQFAWSLILVIGMYILPKSPRFYIKKGRGEKAALALARLRRLDVNHPAIVTELDEVRANHEPKPAFFTTRRAFAPISVGISRTPVWHFLDEDNKHESEIPKFEVWGSNLTQDEVKVELRFKLYDITHKKSLEAPKSQTFTLKPNCTTALTTFKPADAQEDSYVILCAALFDNSTGAEVCRKVSWPEPYRYLDLPEDSTVEVKVEGEDVTLSCGQFPVKGLVAYVHYEDGEEADWEDNMWDLMPGDVVSVAAKGLGGRKVHLRHFANNP